MLQDFFTRLRSLGNRGAQPRLPAGAADADDPMAHPELRAMSTRELADIPFPRPTRRRVKPMGDCSASRC